MEHSWYKHENYTNQTSNDETLYHEKEHYPSQEQEMKLETTWLDFPDVGRK